MKLGTSLLVRLSDMICGDSPYKDYFPYRTSSQLTKFFVHLDLDYAHDGSTRAHWVRSVLVELNEEDESSDEMPSPEMTSVIEAIVDPEHFAFMATESHSKAVETMNKSLKPSNLVIIVDPNSKPRLAPLHGEFISTLHREIPAERLITFKPEIFKVPKEPINPKLVSVMMPFSANFNATFKAIQRSTDHLRLECLRADNIWEDSTILQDIFSLIFRSQVVVVDFSGKNPNVMYETGIAHTLGKNVVPITRSLADVPSDIGHHRALEYLPNEEGYRDLSNKLYRRLKSLFAIS